MIPQHDPLTTPPECDPEPGWGHSLSRGAPGIALLHIERARAGIGDWATAHQWAFAATRAGIIANPHSGLFDGPTAVAFMLHAAAQSSYAKALHILDGSVRTLMRCKLDQAQNRMDRGQLPSLHEYDLISGLTGLGVYLLRKDPDGMGIRAVLSYIVRLTEPIRHHGMTVPGWWTPNGPTDVPVPHFPGGHANLGMAHGIAGPLALLARTMMLGITVPHHAEAISRICSWTDRWRQGRGNEVWWPPWVTFSEHRSNRHHGIGPPRPSWCYGTPGQARAQQLAGRAIGDADRQSMAEAALLGCATNEHQLDQLTDASLCHGWAGLVHTVWRAIGIPAQSDLRVRLARCLDAPLPDLGLLNGASGATLAVHTSLSCAPPTSGWDACLLVDD
jgi:hypothetical protein